MRKWHFSDGNFFFVRIAYKIIAESSIRDKQNTSFYIHAIYFSAIPFDFTNFKNDFFLLSGASYVLFKCKQFISLQKEKKYPQIFHRNWPNNTLFELYILFVSISNFTDFFFVFRSWLGLFLYSEFQHVNVSETLIEWPNNFPKTDL